MSDVGGDYAGRGQVPAATVYVEPDDTATGPRLAHFPVTFFATVMGLAGLSLVWTRAAVVIDVPAWIGEALFWVSLGTYAALLLGRSSSRSCSSRS